MQNVSTQPEVLHSVRVHGQRQKKTKNYFKRGKIVTIFTALSVTKMDECNSGVKVGICDMNKT